MTLVILRRALHQCLYEAALKGNSTTVLYLADSQPAICSHLYTCTYVQIYTNSWVAGGQLLQSILLAMAFLSVHPSVTHDKHLHWCNVSHICTSSFLRDSKAFAISISSRRRSRSCHKVNITIISILQLVSRNLTSCTSNSSQNKWSYTIKVTWM